MKMPITAASIAAAAFLLSARAPAQWLNYPAPGISRTPDGKPNLTAPVPRANGKVDISEIWVADTPRDLVNLAGGGSEVSFQPWAEEQYKKNKATEGRGDPEARCMPHGVPKVDTLPYPFKIFAMPGKLLILHEIFYQYRQIFTDGRESPKEILNPSWLGYSKGDGDDFVVDTAAFNEKFWTDTDGHPPTDALHVTERFKRTDFGHMKPSHHRRSKGVHQALDEYDTIASIARYRASGICLRSCLRRKPQPYAHARQGVKVHDDATRLYSSGRSAGSGGPRPGIGPSASEHFTAKHHY